jgi:hypothetical protein
VADRNDDEYALMVHLLDRSMCGAIELKVVELKVKA